MLMNLGNSEPNLLLPIERSGLLFDGHGEMAMGLCMRQMYPPSRWPARQIFSIPTPDTRHQGISLDSSFLPRDINEYLEQSNEPLKDGIKLLNGSPACKRFLNDLVDDTFSKGMVCLVRDHLPLFEQCFFAPFNQRVVACNAMFMDVYQKVLRQKSGGIERKNFLFHTYRSVFRYKKIRR
ncbi:unnamed protein product [Cuscuta epithymum]|uniref:Uncharacterized protein n=1 Tax=Cuscuta epithymum TaxID=186058 RepID=A0AAV0EEC0_9ASTE|nr:unnamed protein product [Cuscuta epithymum]